MTPDRFGPAGAGEGGRVPAARYTAAMGKRSKGTRDAGVLRAALAAAVVAEDAALAGPRVVLSREQSRRVDDLCVRRFGMPSILLMENAAAGLERVARQALAACERAGARPRVLIVCGPGNNGGDGLALARRLFNAGLGPRLGVVLGAAARRYRGDAAVNARIARRVGVRLVAAGRRPGLAVGSEAARLGRPLLVVDAILGTGLTRPAEGPMLELVRAVNALRDSPGVAVLAVDVPSGLDSNTGAPPPGGEAVVADATHTLAAMKVGLAREAARAWTGVVGVGSIGAPAAAVTAAARTGRTPVARKNR